MGKIQHACNWKSTAILLVGLTALVSARAGAGSPTQAPREPLRLAWEKNILTVAAPWLPGGSVEIWYLEAFCRTGATDRDWRETVIPHETRLVSANEEGTLLRLKSTVEPGIEVQHTLTAGTDEVDFRLTLTNKTDRDVDIDWAQPCIRVGKFTGLGQDEYIRRSFIFTDDGLTMLDAIPRTLQARYRGGQVYVPPGIDKADVNPRPISPVEPANGLIGCFSADEKLLLATAWDHTQELFQGVIVCLHNDFRVGGLKAKETKQLHGKLYLMPNDPAALLARYELDFPSNRSAAPKPERGAELVEVRKIWDKAPHNAFTDLVRFKDRWFCVFREGAAHVSPDGALRVITSEDGHEWTSAALLTSETADLRDAKITLTPDGRLMLGGAGALHPPSKIRHRSLVWYSDDGHEWSDPIEIGDPNLWIWRHSWHDGKVYSIGYDTVGEDFVRLYTSRDGKHFDTLVENLFDKGEPNETSLIFRDDGTCLCLLRRDGEQPSAQLGRSRPPYTQWTWKDLGVRLGGPHMLELPDGRILAAGRRYEGGPKTVLYELDPEAAKLHELLVLPSGGDTSYPGLVWHKGLLWMSYYASHEGKTSIYLAKVRLPALPPRQ